MSEPPDDLARVEKPVDEVIPPEQIKDRNVWDLLEGYRGPPLGLFLRRFTSDHITQMNAEEARENERAHHRYLARNRSLLSMLVIVLAFVIYLVERLAGSNPELLKQLIQTIVSFVGGIGVGAGGITYLRRPKDDEKKG